MGASQNRLVLKSFDKDIYSVCQSIFNSIYNHHQFFQSLVSRMVSVGHHLLETQNVRVAPYKKQIVV